MTPIEKLSLTRLQGEKFAARHEELLAKMHADSRVMTTLGGIRSREDHREYMIENIEHWEKHGFGKWVFFDSENQFISRGGLLCVTIEGSDEVELNYSVAADFWGRGYATEMAVGILSVGFEELALTSIVAFTLETNVPSQRVMQKVGMSFERNFTWKDWPHVLYRICRE